MHYPLEASTFGWGAAIGLGALAALGTALLFRPGGTTAPPIGRAALALLAAFAGFELVLAAAALVMPSGSGAFAPAVVLRLFAINAAALGLLLAARRLASVLGLPRNRRAALKSG